MVHPDCVKPVISIALLRNVSYIDLPKLDYLCTGVFESYIETREVLRHDLVWPTLFQAATLVDVVLLQLLSTFIVV